MRLFQSMLLASVAILALPSCSSAQAPGEIGTKEDIVVHNYGDAPTPPPADDLALAAGGSEALLQQGAAASAEMTAQKTQAAGEAVPPPAMEETAPPMSPQEAAAAMAPDRHIEPVGAPLEAHAQESAAPAEAAPAIAAAGTPVVDARGVPVVDAVSNETPATASADASLATRPAVTAGGNTPTLSPDVDAGGKVRPSPQADAPGETIGEVTAPAVEQSAEEFQNQPVEQAAEEALANPPVSAPATAAASPAPGAAAQQASAAPATAYPPRTSLRPTSEDIAAGGMRVVVTDNGQYVEKPFEGNAAPADASASMPAAGAGVSTPPSAAMPATPAAPVQAAPMQDGKPVLDRAMITRAQEILTQQGFYTGPADGEMSTEMMNALSRYQAANHLTPGAMTVETARHMGLIQ